jgi:uronate dehydrogenase
MSSVLITGSSGRIGRAVVAELLRRGHRVRGFDLRGDPDLADTCIGSVTDREALDRSTKGMDALIHLAATPDDADFLADLLPNNIVGGYHVLESARLAGVKRIVLASTGQINWWQQRSGGIPVRPEDPPSPRYWYAATKMFMESIGRGYAETHGISVIIARLGWCPRGEEHLSRMVDDPWAHDVYLSPGDAGRFFACAIEAPDSVRHLVVNAASRHVHRQQFDMTSARTHLGYEPRDTWPQGCRD